MTREYIAYAFIAVGALALLSRISAGSGWFWVGLVAAGFLVGYVRTRSYGLLVVGSILTGIAVGLLLEEGWGWSGAFTISLGIGFLAIDRIEQRSSRWPRVLGLVLVGLGVLGGLLDSGVLGSFWFALLLIIAGAYLLLGRGRSWPGWVEVGPRAPTATGPTVPPQADESAHPAETRGEPHPSDVEARRRALEAWRLETAAREDRSATLILTAETLDLLARQNPQTLDELGAVRGIGPVKLERYGPGILEVLRSV